MTFEKAPEKIWACDAKLGSPDDKYWWPNDDTGGTEYTRSDIAKADWYMRAEVSRLEKVVSSLEVYIMQMEDKIDSLEKSDD
jgi:hypothetical protein